MSQKISNIELHIESQKTRSRSRHASHNQIIQQMLSKNDKGTSPAEV